MWNFWAAIRRNGLVKKLDSRNWRERRDAVMKLHELGDTSITSRLLKLIYDTDKDVRNAVVEVLQSFCNSEETEALLAGLKDSSADVRIASAQILREIDNPRVLAPLLCVAITDPEEVVRNIATESFLQTRLPGKIPLLAKILMVDDEAARTVAVSLLGRLGDSGAVKPLVQVLGKTTSLDILIVMALGQLRSRHAIPSLTRCLASNCSKLRHEAASALKMIGWEKADDTIMAMEYTHTNVLVRLVNEDRIPDSLMIGLLADESAQKRTSVVETLSELKDSRWQPHIVAALQDNEGKIRSIVANSLAQQGATEILVENAANPQSIARFEALQALVEINSPALPEIYRSLLGSTNSRDRAVAVTGLCRMNSANICEICKNAITDSGEEVRLAAVKIMLEQNDERYFPYLLTAVDDTSAEIRKTTIRGLGELNYPDICDVSAAAFKDKNRDVRLVAMKTLLAHKDQCGLDHLTPAVKDNDLEIRQLAIKLISDLKLADSFNILKTALQDSNEGLRLSAAKALAALKDERSGSIFVELLSDRSWAIRNYAKTILDQKDQPGKRKSKVGNYEKTYAKPKPEKMNVTNLKDEDRLNVLFAMTAGSPFNSEQAIDVLNECAKSDDYHIRAWAIKLLGEQNSRRVFDVIMGFWNDPNNCYAVECAIIESLVRLGDQRAFPVILEAIFEGGLRSFLMGSPSILRDWKSPSLYDPILSRLQTADSYQPVEK